MRLCDVGFPQLGIYGCQPKNRGGKKMDGENFMETPIKMDDLVIPLFLETPIYVLVIDACV